MALPWTLHGDGTKVGRTRSCSPAERLTWPRTIGLGAQHVVAMFGATFLVPLLTGFPPGHHPALLGRRHAAVPLITGNRLPSYLGSSFAFIVPIIAATAAHGMARRSSGSWSPACCSPSVGLIVQLDGDALDRRADAAGGGRRDRRADRLQPRAGRRRRTSPRPR